MSLIDKEGLRRLREGEEIGLTDKKERRRIGQQVKKLVNAGFGPGDALAAARENVGEDARRGRDLDFS